MFTGEIQGFKPFHAHVSMVARRSFLSQFSNYYLVFQWDVLETKGSLTKEALELFFVGDIGIKQTF